VAEMKREMLNRGKKDACPGHVIIMNQRKREKKRKEIFICHQTASKFPSILYFIRLQHHTLPTKN
jgi:hypothetical protein